MAGEVGINNQRLDNAGKVRRRPLYEMFNAVPPRYDLVNHLITFELDACWRLKAARVCLTPQPNRVLDLGCGTGDLAMSIARLAPDGVEVTGLDYSRPMLRIAARKAESLGRKPIFVHGDAANLPFSDGYFDRVGISFAFRNLTYRNPMAQRYLAEVLRVLAPGGKFVIVETSQPARVLVRKLFHFYLYSYVKWIGALVSRNKGAYRYLAESAVRFYSPDELSNLLRAAGFRSVSCQPLFFGVVGICVAVK